MNRRSSFNLYAVIIAIVSAEFILLLLFIRTDLSSLMEGVNKVTEDYMPMEEGSTPTENKVQEGKQDNAKGFQPSSAEEKNTSKAALWDPAMAKGSSYYYVEDDMLYHHVKGGAGGSFIYGPAPDFMSQNQKYYSPNGSTFF
ncbi:hypothetical protein RWE15_15745 [Virgibacillus halophilus]|uniref:Uncharacterized protein n=2 Tax=Tigheibacillus halophilus TaxID=361280 RepID=A0ABU5C8F3_9BACI|nr:hypothetical protein [Virgibacillus halophilus]